jgi:hypothetical protein
MITNIKFYKVLSLPFIVIGILAIALSGSTASAGGQSAGNHVANHRPIKHLRHGTSSNWSGYAVYGGSGSFNTVSAKWTQPAVTCNSQSTYSSYWVGLDGYNSNTVEQLGTEADCSSGSPSYYAWFEMYPKWGYYINMTVHSGDVFSASVTYSGGKYNLSLTNQTTKQTFNTRQKSPRAQRASAEAIVEAPWNGGTLPLANFGTANFTNSLVNGTAMGSYPNKDPITMINPYGMRSTPSNFDSTNQSFHLTWSAN